MQIIMTLTNILEIVAVSSVVGTFIGFYMGSSIQNIFKRKTKTESI